MYAHVPSPAHAHAHARACYALPTYASMPMRPHTYSHTCTRALTHSPTRSPSYLCMHTHVRAAHPRVVPASFRGEREHEPSLSSPDGPPVCGCSVCSRYKKARTCELSACPPSRGGGADPPSRAFPSALPFLSTRPRSPRPHYRRRCWPPGPSRLVGPGSTGGGLSLPAPKSPTLSGQGTVNPAHCRATGGVG